MKNSISEASDEELNRFIANVFEPKPDEPNPTDTDYQSKAWVLIPAIVDRAGNLVDPAELEPFDFISSGDGLKMVLERLLVKHGPSYEIGRIIEGFYCAIEDAGGVRPRSSLGRAVAEAFALANGWEE